MGNTATRIWERLVSISTPCSIAYLSLHKEIVDFGFWDTISTIEYRVALTIAGYLERHNDIQIF